MNKLVQQSGQPANTLHKKPKPTIAEVQTQIKKSPHLDGTHSRANVSCESCHGSSMSTSLTVPTDQTCLSCHLGSYEKLASKLKEKDKFKSYNPHASAHERQACITCHSSHSEFTLTCASCHSITTDRFH